MRSRTFRTLLAAGAVTALGWASAQTEPVMTGTFVQLNGQLTALSEEQWARELGYMREIGMDTVIVQYSRYGETVYFPTSQALDTGAADESGAQLPPNESVGTLTWRAPSGATARHVRIEVRPNSREWTMIPEIRIVSDGQNVAAGSGYSLTPAPAGTYLDPDARGGGKLTDGFANFAWGDMVGWQNPGDRILIDFDLGTPTPLDEVLVDFMRSDISAVEVPSGFAVSVSADGQTFLPLGPTATWGEDSVTVDVTDWDPLGRILAAAEQHDMHVWLGLSLDPDYWQGVFDPVASSESNIALMLELEGLYGASPALAGYYLPEEIDDRSFVTERAHGAMIEYLAAMVGAAHGLVGRPVMVAPYFGMNPDADAYAAWWDATLSRAPVDVIAMQDGVGTRRTTAEQGAPVYRALQPVAAKHGVALWSDLEVFEQTHGWPVNDLPWRAQPATIGSVVEQLELEAPYVEKFVVFDFTHYMSPRLGAAASELYRAYQSHLEERAP